MSHDTMLERIRAEFLEMPGLRLTPAQAQRLFGIERGVCQEVLDTLVGSRFLWMNPNGTYARPTSEATLSHSPQTNTSLDHLPPPAKTAS
jgi:hypothetical protein